MMKLGTPHFKSRRRLMGDRLRGYRDFNAKPEMCSVYMETKDGGNCWAVVECKDGMVAFHPSSN